MDLNNQGQKSNQMDEMQGTGEAAKETYVGNTVTETFGTRNAAVHHLSGVSVNWIGLYTMVRREVRRTFRVAIQTLVAPVISAALYIFIFGTVIGTRIDDFAGVPYISFVFPGVLMLSIINSSFASASSALYFMRFTRSIEEILITPFSYLEMLVGFVGSAIARSLMVAFLILGVGLLFGAVSLVNPVAFILYVMGIAAIFAMLGILTALWAEGFEQLQSLNTFVITPLTYLGGIFYSITFLPDLAATLTRLNPFFYFADGIRSSMIGYSEANTTVGIILTVSIILALALLVTHLFRIGWKIRS